MMAELQPSIKEIKEKVFQDHLTTGIQLDRLRDDLQVEIKDLRKSLWYQCDHMKFVNLINNKFSELNKKIDKHIYKPNAKMYFDNVYKDESEENEKENDESKHDSDNKDTEFYKAVTRYNFRV